MKVHLITSRQTLVQDIETLRRIRDIVRASGRSLTLDWIDTAYKRNVQDENHKANWNDIFRQNVEAIAKSDVIIAETSHENFAVGYQVALALQQKKPILLLHHAIADKNAFATGVVDDWVQHKEYNDNTLEAIVNGFLDENDIKLKDMRFNFFIDRKIYNYLRWAALRTGKTKAEILRDLVEREIDRESS